MSHLHEDDDAPRPIRPRKGSRHTRRPTSRIAGQEAEDRQARQARQVRQVRRRCRQGPEGGKGKRVDSLSRGQSHGSWPVGLQEVLRERWEGDRCSGHVHRPGWIDHLQGPRRRQVRR
eukprot:3380292-Prymnesium_polylepis.1